MSGAELRFNLGLPAQNVGTPRGLFTTRVTAGPESWCFGSRQLDPEDLVFPRRSGAEMWPKAGQCSPTRKSACDRCHHIPELKQLRDD